MKSNKTDLSQFGKSYDLLTIFNFYLGGIKNKINNGTK